VARFHRSLEREAPRKKRMAVPAKRPFVLLLLPQVIPHSLESRRETRIAQESSTDVH
jgi:hypothetical protein